MKKKVKIYFEILVLIILILLIFPLSSAVLLEMKDNYNRGETLIAKVSGNFLTGVQKANVFIYRKDNQIRVPSEFNVKKFGEDYYIYSQLLGKSSGNYSLVIKSTRYVKVLGEVSTEDILKNFTITENIADFSAEPGFIETTGNFSIKIKNLKDEPLVVNVLAGSSSEENGASNTKNIWDSIFGSFNKAGTGQNASSGNAQKSISLIPGEEKEIEFNNFSSEENTLKKIVLSSNGNTTYEIPVYIIGTGKEENPSIETKNKFAFEKEEIEIEVKANETRTEKIILENYDNTKARLNNITVYPSYEIEKIVSVSPDKISAMDYRDDREIGIVIKMNPEDLGNFIKSNAQQKNYYGKVNALSQEGISALIYLNITFIKGNYTTQLNSNGEQIKNCAELGGKICKTGEKCSLSEVLAKDGSCCRGMCLQETNASVTKLVGWLLVIIAALFVLWFFFKRYRKPKQEVSVLKAAEGKKQE